MKYLYWLVSLGSIAIALTLSIWFYGDIIYLFERIIDPYQNFPHTPLIRFLSVLASWFLGFSYLYYGLRSQKINLLSNISIILLVVTPVAYLITALFSCISFGGTCSAFGTMMNNFSQIVAILGPSLSVFLCLLSLFMQRKSTPF